MICLPALATIINIPDDYPTIQQGIDASSDGDTVLAQPGTYVENINFNGHNIVLGSLFLTTGDTTHISQTIIDGSSSGRVITLDDGEDSTTVICGLTIKNGLALLGAGIYCADISSFTIRDNYIIENSADAYGGGIYCFRSSPIIIRNTIRGNSAAGDYGLGGGLYCNDSNPPIHDNIITDNYGSGICCENADPLIRGNLISDNLDSGIICRTGSHATITGNIISGNTALCANSYGGGICCVSSHPTIDNNTICQNSVMEDGGGIFCHHYCGPTIINNVIYENTAGTHGGGIHCGVGSSPTIRNNTIIGNYATYGGGILFSDTSPTTKNTILWANSAPYGPEIYSYHGWTEISYCDIQGGWEGEGNIDIEPLFRDAENGDFHLMSTECGDPDDSPCIDAGDPSILDYPLDCDWGLGSERSDMGAYGGGSTASDCAYIPGDCNYNDVPLELADVIAMIGMYRGSMGAPYECSCSPHGDDFPPTADPNGNCIAFELGDVVTEIAAYRGTAAPQGCPDCPGSGRLLRGSRDQPAGRQ
jgi:parallel beta-helix repeat protein